MPGLRFLLCLLVLSRSAAADTFNLSSIPLYTPHEPVSGTIRNFGYPLAGMLPIWEEGFRKYHPDVHFDDRFPSGDAAVAGLVAGVSDLGPQGREQTLVEHLLFFETFGYAASSVTVATGAYDVAGSADGIVIFVNAHNPIARLTMQQVAGVFGARRTGSFDGFKWVRANASGAAEEIRTWGQLGLTGEWADKEIHTYGHAPSGTTNYFQLAVLQGSDKWNPNYREYVETGTKMIGPDDPQQLGGLHHMLADELTNDPYGIAWSVLPQAHDIRGLKILALASKRDSPYVAPSPQTFQDHSYPLSRSIYLYFNRPPGQSLDPEVREFLRYVLSREAQEATQREGKYLPLSGEIVKEQLRKLE